MPPLTGGSIRAGIAVGCHRQPVLISFGAIPTSSREIPITIFEIPSTVLEIAIAVREVASTMFEIPTTIREIPTTIFEIATATFEGGSKVFFATIGSQLGHCQRKWTALSSPEEIGRPFLTRRREELGWLINRR